jgi:glycosyltransferase involved in cell wall biosynthesis
MERDLLRKADLCFGTAHSLVDYLKQQNPNTYLALHGVDHGHFARALDPATTIPDDVANLPRPVIGFFGAIHEWMDLPLIAHLAQRHPEWSIVLIGQAEMGTEAIRGLPNVHLLGPRPYQSLPGYCKALAVGLIPFVINEMTLHINPIKLREYLSAGLPVVSTGLPEVRRYGSSVRLGETPEAFVRQVELACAEDSPEQRRARSAALKDETWEGVVERVCATIEQAKAAKTK